jgi:hypothetical protein
LRRCDDKTRGSSGSRSGRKRKQNWEKEEEYIRQMKAKEIDEKSSGN